MRFSRERLLHCASLKTSLVSFSCDSSCVVLFSSSPACGVQGPLRESCARESHQQPQAVMPWVRSLQLRELRFGFLQNGDVGVGVFPEAEEVLVLDTSLGSVA